MKIWWEARIMEGFRIWLLSKTIKTRFTFKETYKQYSDGLDQLEVLVTMAETQPRAAYSAHVYRFKYKCTFFLQIMPNISGYNSYQSLQAAIYAWMLKDIF